ncbi:MAG: isoprenylcysteine carboxylmethyltransferase family protein [Ignavibacteria bacterium]|nr:isoprenylcysteine carboxylmethyltransferase family protein [Ignavibacteria bacterium]
MKITGNKAVHALLVILQLSFSAAIIFSGPLFPSSLVLIAVSFGALIFALWAMTEMKFRFSIFPVPAEGAELVTTGPFAVVRHPMYTSLLAWTLCLVLGEPKDFRFALWILLFAVLLIKSVAEEKILSARFSEYSEYRKSTKRIIPYVI